MVSTFIDWTLAPLVNFTTASVEGATGSTYSERCASTAEAGSSTRSRLEPSDGEAAMWTCSAAIPDRSEAPSRVAAPAPRPENRDVGARARERPGLPAAAGGAFAKGDRRGFCECHSGPPYGAVSLRSRGEVDRRRAGGCACSLRSAVGRDREEGVQPARGQRDRGGRERRHVRRARLVLGSDRGVLRERLHRDDGRREHEPGDPLGQAGLVRQGGRGRGRHRAALAAARTGPPIPLQVAPGVSTIPTTSRQLAFVDAGASKCTNRSEVEASNPGRISVSSTARPLISRRPLCEVKAAAVRITRPAVTA